MGSSRSARVLPIAPSTYFRHKAQQRGSRRGGRRGRSAMTSCARSIRRVWDEHHQVYGPRKVWRQMRPRGHRASRAARVRRLMRADGPASAPCAAGRGSTTTQADAGRDRPPRSGRAALHGDATESALGRRTSRTSRPGAASSTSRSSSTSSRAGSSAGASRRRCATDFVLDALEQAIYARCGDARRRPRASQRSRHAVSVDALHRSARRRRHRAVGRQPRRLRTTTPSPNRSSGSSRRR